MPEDSLTIELVGFDKERDVIREYAELAQMTVYESIYRFARKLAFELYARSKEFTMPDGRDAKVQAIFELPAQLQWHIKRRRKGLTVEQEIWLRARAVGYGATGWLAQAKLLGANEDEAGEDEPVAAGDLMNKTEVWRLGGLEIHLNGTTPYVQIVNMTASVEHIEARYGIVAKAIEEVTADVEAYIQRKLDELEERAGT